MKTTAEQVGVTISAMTLYIVLPAAIMAAWILWVRRRALETPISLLSLVAFALAPALAYWR
jgi:hypothetical protein